MKFVHFANLDSTNAEAGRRADAGDFGPMWISADIQTAGKARRGRHWVSDTGNLFCTGLYPYAGALADAAKLSFVAALAMAETLEHYIDPALIAIKWPNDVLIDGKKVAGILLESGSHNGNAWVAVGMGINLISSPEVVDYKATHLLEHIEDKASFTGTQPMITLLADRFEYWRKSYTKSGFSPIRETWLKRAQGIGDPAIARLPNETIEGTALGMDVNGALELKTKSGQVVKIHAGDVFFS